jgi:lipopolysaccharide cholinephosphotransferase
MSVFKAHKYMKQGQIDQLYLLIKEVDEVLTKMGIPYFVIGGTLLGAIRHQGLIPWDDDIDIGIFEKDLDLLYTQRFQRHLEKRGLVLNEDGDLGILKIHFKKGNRIKGHTHKFPFLDIFVYKKTKAQGTQKYILADEDARFIWPKDAYPKTDLFPIVNYTFGPLQLPGPFRAKKLLKKIYGSDVFDYYYEEYDHQTEKKRRKVKAKMTAWDYIPILPSSTTFCWKY